MSKIRGLATRECDVRAAAHVESRARNGLHPAVFWLLGAALVVGPLSRSLCRWRPEASAAVVKRGYEGGGGGTDTRVRARLGSDAQLHLVVKGTGVPERAAFALQMRARSRRRSPTACAQGSSASYNPRAVVAAGGGGSGAGFALRVHFPPNALHGATPSGLSPPLHRRAARPRL
ncbi:unnamed protein product [Lampetra planeri]